MTMIEDQLTALLKAAPGEPPVAIDPGRLMHTSPPRRGRLLAPLLVAAMVAALATALTFAGHGGGPLVPRKHAVVGGIHSAPGLESSRRHAAIAWVRAALDHVAGPPGAGALGSPAIHVDNADFSVSGQTSRTWTAPASLPHTMNYLRTHPPAGMSLTGNGARVLGYRNTTGTRSLLYKAVAHAGGVTLTIDATAEWTPVRPAWSYITGTFTSADVTVIRRELTSHHLSAPTVHRKITGVGATILARSLNSLPARRPMPADWHCMPSHASDTVVVQATDGTLTFAEGRSSCAGVATISATGRHKVYIDSAALDALVLRALGLPPDYGLPSAGVGAGRPAANGGSLMSRPAAEALARQAINAPDSAPTFSRLMTVAAFEKTFRETVSSSLGTREVWVVTVHAPARTDGSPETAPVTRNVYSIAIDATTGEGTDDCVGCDWVKADH